MTYRRGFMVLALAVMAVSGAAHAESDNKPLLTINFNQKHIYFERALSQAVTAAEQIMPKVIYTVASYVPPGADGQAMAPEAGDNLRAVVQRMQAGGVPAERIQVMSYTYPQGRERPYQKVAVFVK